MKKNMDWISKNKEWLFSGIAGTILICFFNYINMQSLTFKEVINPTNMKLEKFWNAKTKLIDMRTNSESFYDLLRVKIENKKNKLYITAFLKDGKNPDNKLEIVGKGIIKEKSFANFFFDIKFKNEIKNYGSGSLHIDTIGKEINIFLVFPSMDIDSKNAMEVYTTKLVSVENDKSINVGVDHNRLTEPTPIVRIRYARPKKIIQS